MKQVLSHKYASFSILLVLAFFAAIVVRAAIGDFVILEKKGLLAAKINQIDKHSVCQRVTNSSTSTEYFLPLKSATEWTAFRNADPALSDISLASCLDDVVTFKPGVGVAADFASDDGHYFLNQTGDLIPNAAVTNLIQYPLWNQADERTNFCLDMGFTTVDSYISSTFTSPGDNFIMTHDDVNTGWWSENADDPSVTNSHVNEIVCSGRQKEFARITIDEATNPILLDLGADYFRHSRWGHSPVIVSFDPEVFDTTFTKSKIADYSATGDQLCKEYGYDHGALFASPGGAFTTSRSTEEPPNAIAITIADYAMWNGSAWVLSSSNPSVLSTHDHDGSPFTDDEHTSYSYYDYQTSILECVLTY